ncbi:MAG: hypothetical protein KJ989_15495 [Gammaproteobacteria bacterium]|nr:hypothetical protein [Gammaproteobacteria bacterium]MBU2154898.1 hypothetical protein [Gammaproteobacteria bacterium]MBU2295605.1 hypothetical protein [Gammaproteobacteria bacterium]
MNLNQQLLFLCEQFLSFEEAVKDFAHKKAEAQFSNGSVSIGSTEHTTFAIHNHISLYEGPVRVRYMQAIQLYSMFERYAISLSHEISSKYKLKEISTKTQDFPEIKKYYTNVCNINFKKWDTLNSLRIVRNLIAHSDGYLGHSKNTTSLRKLSETEKNITILSNDRLVFNGKFFKQSLGAVFEFFDLVFEKLGDQDYMLTFDYKLINEFVTFDTAITV